MRTGSLTLGPRQVGEGQACFVLAAVASAHGGSAERALEMIEAAFKRGFAGVGANDAILALQEVPRSSPCPDALALSTPRSASRWSSGEHA